MPTPSEEDEFYLRTFWNLSTDRQFGFAAGPIPYGAIKAEARDLGLDDDARQIFVRVMQELDKVFLAHCEEERKNREKT